MGLAARGALSHQKGKGMHCSTASPSYLGMRMGSPSPGGFEPSSQGGFKRSLFEVALMEMGLGER